MKNELKKIVYSGIFLLIWGIAAPCLIPGEALFLTWIVLPLFVVFLIRYSNNIYMDILYSLILIFLQNRLDILFGSGLLDQVGRDLLLLSFYATTFMVFLVWLVALFSVIKKRQKIETGKIFSSYLPYLLIINVLSVCLYRFILY